MLQGQCRWTGSGKDPAASCASCLDWARRWQAGWLIGLCTPTGCRCHTRHRCESLCQELESAVSLGSTPRPLSPVELSRADSYLHHLLTGPCHSHAHTTRAIQVHHLVSVENTHPCKPSRPWGLAWLSQSESALWLLSGAVTGGPLHLPLARLANALVEAEVAGSEGLPLTPPADLLEQAQVMVTWRCCYRPRMTVSTFFGRGAVNTD